MALYHYDITGENPFKDDQGFESTDDGAAWREGLRLTRDLEENLRPNGRWTLTVRDGARIVYLIEVSASQWIGA